MQRWAKSMNKQKERGGLGPARQEERRESAAADAGFTLFEKKVCPLSTSASQRRSVH